MADRSSVLQGLKSSPKGQLCYDEKMKKERIWTCISCIRVERVVEEHYSRGNKLGAAGVSAASPGALGPNSGSPRGDGREERETDLASELLGLSSTSVAEQERRSSKDGEEAAHGCRSGEVRACTASSPLISRALPVSPAPPCAVFNQRPSTILAKWPWNRSTSVVRVTCGGGRRGGNRWGWGEGDVWWREERRKRVGVG